MKLKTFLLFQFLSSGFCPGRSRWCEKEDKIYRIGWLGPTYRAFDKVRLEELQIRLGQGENFVIAYQSWGCTPDRIPALAAELSRHKVDFIFAVHATDTFRERTSKIPLCLLWFEDALGRFCISLARPGRNVTGVSSNLIEITGKALQLLKEAVPGASRIACLYNPARASCPSIFRNNAGCCSYVGLKLQSVQAKDPRASMPHSRQWLRSRLRGLWCFPLHPITTMSSDRGSGPQKQSPHDCLRPHLLALGRRPHELCARIPSPVQERGPPH